MINLIDFVRQQKQAEDDFMRKHDNLMKEIGELKILSASVMMPKLRKCKGKEYNKWLKEFIANAGTPTHYYDYRSDSWNWYSANNDFIIVPLYGATAFSIIANEGICIDTSGGTGHINIYQFGKYDNHYVPVFSDSVDYMKL